MTGKGPRPYFLTQAEWERRNPNTARLIKAFASEARKLPTLDECMKPWADPRAPEMFQRAYAKWQETRERLELDEKQQKFVAVHELMHAITDKMYREGATDEELQEQFEWWLQHERHRS